MQEIMKQYADQATPGDDKAGAAGVTAALKKAGRRPFAAMFYAQKSACKCDACRLLRAEINEIMTDMMGSLASEDDSTDS